MQLENSHLGHGMMKMYCDTHLPSWASHTFAGLALCPQPNPPQQAEVRPCSAILRAFRILGRTDSRGKMLQVTILAPCCLFKARLA